jgi:hypothetical protein
MGKPFKGFPIFFEKIIRHSLQLSSHTTTSDGMGNLVLLGI